MSRIDAAFAGLRARRRKALVPYITVGDPQADGTASIMSAMAAAGADVIELGVPFSDPMADGPVIQRAGERALARGVGMRHVLAAVREFRRHDGATPVVLMGYANPIERYGSERFADAAADAGVDGVLVVDYPPEECEPFVALLGARAIDPIFLIAPTSTDARIASVAAVARGYVYHVSLKGVTGAGGIDIASVARTVDRIKTQVQLPVGVGFGIRDAETARAVAEVADAVVIGTALVQRLEAAGRGEAPRVGAAFIAEMRAAMDASHDDTSPRAAAAFRHG